MIQGSCHCGAVRWTFDGIPKDATACNCTVCRRCGALWAYDYEGGLISVSGPTQGYGRNTRELDFHFCQTCGCVAYWRSNHVVDGRRRMAVNLRLAEPEVVAGIILDHFDGLVTFQDLGRDGRCVKDLWF